LTNSPSFSERITEKDRYVLESLEKITTTLHETGYGTTVHFTFGQNDYFTNEVLSIEIKMPYNNEDASEIISTEINWNAGKDLTAPKK